MSSYLIILSILGFFIPDTYFKSDADAVFTLTPTLLTAFETTKSKLSDNFLADTSCWYKPTPIPSGGTFTSSDNGSWSLLPIDTALLFSTAKSGNSSIAILDAL